MLQFYMLISFLVTVLGALGEICFALGKKKKALCPNQLRLHRKKSYAGILLEGLLPKKLQLMSFLVTSAKFQHSLKHKKGSNLKMSC